MSDATGKHQQIVQTDPVEIRRYPADEMWSIVTDLFCVRRLNGHIFFVFFVSSMRWNRYRRGGYVWYVLDKLSVYTKKSVSKRRSTNAAPESDPL